ncbi:hypothetical protein L208DRAFT_1253081, partial [Tricholoma matsutake]
LPSCRVQGYILRNVQCPDPSQDPASNWDFNDTYAKVLIANNVTTTKMVHISQSHSTYDSWSNLKAVHNAKSHQMMITIICNLYCTSAKDGDNIADHLNELK